VRFQALQEAALAQLGAVEAHLRAEERNDPDLIWPGATRRYPCSMGKR
jgi:hypothetical protein